ncbi:MAG: hypothetical protein ORN57_03020, partial [Alphaproteobacteria bacterium]|nr:hypothetical protein [Alphaproteobacteria bacterium]
MRKRIFTALRLLALCAFNLLHDLAGFQWLAPHLTSWGAAAFYLVKYSPSLGPLLTHVSRETCRFIGRLISC